MPFTGIDRSLWAIGLFGHLALLSVLLARHRAIRFPMFTALISANIVRTLLLYSLRSNDRAYVTVYLLAHVLDVVLQLAVVYEVARHVFRPNGRWAPDVHHAMFWLTWGSLALATGLTWLAAPNAPGLERTALLKSEFFSSALMSELFLGMVGLSVTVGLPWKTHDARIAHGLGAFSLLDIAIEAVHTVHGGAGTSNIQDALTVSRMIVYLFCLLYWIVTLWQEAPQPRELPQKLLADLRTLNARVAYDLYTLRNWKKP